MDEDKLKSSYKNTKSFSQSNNSKQSSDICSFYSKYKNCKFGDNCRFLHYENSYGSRQIQSKAGTSSFYNSDFKRSKGFFQHMTRNNTKSTVNPTEDELTTRDVLNTEGNKNEFNRICRYFKAGYCYNGTKCTYRHGSSFFQNESSTYYLPQYAHVTKRNRSITSKKKSIPLCIFFQKGSCFKGEACKFYHGNASERESDKTINTKTTDNSVSTQNVYTNNKLIQDKEFSSSESELQRTTNKSNTLNHENSTKNINAQNMYTNDKLIQDKEFSSSESELLKNNLNNADIERTTNKSNTLNHESSTKNINSAEKDSSANFYVNNISTSVSSAHNFRFLNLSSLAETDLFHLRDTEIIQLRKRFPNGEVDEANECFSFFFQPSDPDWPYDLKLLKMQAKFPEIYPLEVCEISVLHGSEYISDNLIRSLNKAISDWLNMRHELLVKQNQVELLFRPFLRWFDKNVEDIFSHEKKLILDDEEANELSTTSSDDASNSKALSRSTAEEQHSDSEEQSCEPTAAEASLAKSNPPVADNQNKGTKILFNGLELVEGAAALSCNKLSVTLHCGRCKTPHDIKTLPNHNNVIVCSKCSKRTECNFNAAILHQFSSVLGTIHLVDCLAVDVNLVECAFLVDCLNCSKQVPIHGLHYGQKQKSWCKFCNQKLIIGIQSVKFQGAVSITTDAKTSSVKKVEKKKDPVIKEGNPLPDFGTCKHYKKSYRWLRFPCCGRLYPCDVCHDEKETSHDMKFASRMICGFCSKEQPYSKEKPCFNCSGTMIAKHSSHWEGGRGCTSKTKMSRHDKQKHVGVCKTVSKKAQQTDKKKKKS